MPLPPDPEDMNEDRAHWARVAIVAFMKETRQTDINEAIGDLICDLGHLADRQGDQGDEIIERGLASYREETARE